MDVLDTTILPDQHESLQKTGDDSKPEAIKEPKPSEGTEVAEPIQEVSSKDTKTECTLTTKEPQENASKTEKPTDTDAKPDETDKKDDEKERLKDKASLKNRSDIFSLNENKNITSTIFSVGGAPSKVIHKSSSINSSSSYDTTGPNKQGQLRNPLTGIGVCSKDEYKNKPSKRKDGNPLLGVGYKDDDEFFNSPPTTRIPPGGYSKGLW